MGIANSTNTGSGGQYLYRQAKSANYTVTIADYLIAYTSTASAYTVTLPATAGSGQVFIVKDESGGAATNNITLSVSGGGTIDGASSLVLNTNYGSVGVYWNGSAYFAL